MKKKRIYREFTIQKSFFEELSYYAIGSYVFHIPNGGYRHSLEAKRFKSIGVKSGIPDVFVAIPTLSYAGLFIEFKSESGEISKAQKDIIEQFIAVGYKVIVCYSPKEAIDGLKGYIGISNLSDFKGVVR